MKRTKTRASALRRLISSLAVLCLVGGASVAGAQPSVQLNRFNPAAQTNDGFAVSSAEVQGDMRFGAQFYIDYANDPLVYEVTPGSASSEAFSVVEHQLTGNLNASLGIRDRLTVSIGLPINFLENGENIPASLQSAGVVDGDGTAPGTIPVYLADGFTLGDLWVGARVRLFGTTDDIFMLSVQGRLVIPTANLFDSNQHYAGERGIAGGAQVIAQLNFGRFRLTANLGAHLRPDNADCRDLPGTSGPGANCFYGARQGDEFTYGLGGTVRLMEDTDLRAILEVHGRTTFQNFFDRTETPLELLAGLKYTHSSGLTAGIGGGPGLVRGFGSPDVRVFAMVGYTEPTAGAVVRIDTDGDGIYDNEDECPNDPEDVDGFEDSNGCPDPDNDSDGILDTDDQCPMEPEDTDGFEDENGCPDPDNDNDGILDANDQCPMDAEDMDSFEDENGCPDPDNDGDGIVDTADRCPLEPGPSANQGCPWPDTDGDTVVDPLDSCINTPGTVEYHGCPEPTDVVIGEGGIEIMQTVYFRTNRDVIESRSFALLDNVARLLIEHPEVQHVRVEGHTDTRGRLANNMRLSQARAESVMRYLVEHGVDAGRLEAQGYGPTRLIVENARTPDEHARNRRVVFTIIGANGDIRSEDSGPSADTIDR
ncbi:MAG: OmpA family protein [Sandaracinaceae bacterium]|nr:OmpA family protein [Sandaracinaceae bacterium]